MRGRESHLIAVVAKSQDQTSNGADLTLMRSGSRARHEAQLSRSSGGTMGVHYGCTCVDVQAWMYGGARIKGRCSRSPQSAGVSGPVLTVAETARMGPAPGRHLGQPPRPGITAAAFTTSRTGLHTSGGMTSRDLADASPACSRSLGRNLHGGRKNRRRALAARRPNHTCSVQGAP